jgi:hypothetical protein
LLGLTFIPENGGSMVLQNVGELYWSTWCYILFLQRIPVKVIAPFLKGNMHSILGRHSESVLDPLY